MKIDNLNTYNSTFLISSETYTLQIIHILECTKYIDIYWHSIKCTDLKLSSLNGRFTLEKFPPFKCILIHVFLLEAQNIMYYYFLFRICQCLNFFFRFLLCICYLIFFRVVFFRGFNWFMIPTISFLLMN